MENVDHFALISNWPSWVQAAISNQPSVGCGFSASSTFKVSAMLFRSFLHVRHLVASVGCGWWSTSVYISFSKILGSSSHMWHLSVSPGIYQQFYQVTPQTPFSLPCPQYFLAPGVPFSVLQPEEKQKRKRKILPFSWKILFPDPWARTRGFLLEPMSSFRLPYVQAGQHWSWQHGKLALGSEVIWSLVFLPNPSATIYSVLTGLLHAFCAGYSCVQWER